MTGKEAKERLQKQYKRQNKSIKEKYDRISVTLPKGTVDRIKALGFTINGLVNDAVLSFLECAEESAGEEEPEDAQSIPEPTHPEEPAANPEKPQKREMTPDELQAILERRRAEDQQRIQQAEEEKERRKDEQAEELENYVKKLRGNLEEARKERWAGYAKIPDHAMIEALRENEGLREDFRLSRDNEATRKNRIEEFGEENYKRFLKCFEIVEQEEKEQKRAETIAAAKFAEK